MSIYDKHKYAGERMRIKIETCKDDEKEADKKETRWIMASLIIGVIFAVILVMVSK